jgi:hypothetical protein
MSDEKSASEPVVVTFDQVTKALGSEEALGQLNEVSNCDDTIPPVQKAAIMACLGNVLDQIRRAEDSAGAKVLTSPNDARAARIQSLIASGEAARLSYAPLPSGGLEAVFDTHDWAGWATVAWEKLKHPIPHPMVRPRTMYPKPFPERGRIGLLGDWGTGLYGAPKIGAAVLSDPDAFEIILHLGDVYYSGTRKEVDDRFLAGWPGRNGSISRALNSNHEMYSGGDAYFGQTLPIFAQSGSHFAYQNAHWTLVGLDTAYLDHAIDDEQVTWLLQIVRNAGDRKIILFSHQQLYSSIEKEQGTKLWSHPQFGALLRSKRIFAWYWGHEHRCIIYELPDVNFGILGRCIGHSGMPQSRYSTIGLRRAAGSEYERADWRFCTAQTVQGNALSRAIVLEGPNELIDGEEEKFLPHGYGVLSLDGTHLVEEIRSATGKVIYARRLV